MKVFLGLAAIAIVGAAAYFMFFRAEDQGRFQVPRGFVVEEVASAEQVGSVVALTFDSLGRPVISKERGGPTILEDKDGDGIYETQKEFTNKVFGAQGLWFDGRTLYAVAANQEKQAGLYKLEDTDGDDAADTFDTVLTFTGPMGEHGPHHIYRGPDGKPILILGNHTGIAASDTDPNSPHANYSEGQLLPRYMDARGHAVNIWAPGGTIWRLNLATGKHSLLVGGLRNAYDMAVNFEGDILSFDSDMEWDLGMPWYREVRTIHAVPGADFGWRTGSGKFPDYFIDNLPPLNELGRGSPVGVEFYQHHAFPREYYDGHIQADWSRGRILYSKLEWDGGTYKTAAEPVNFVYGEPLNVTDTKVAPDGSLWFTLGGRDTEGGIYRVIYKGWGGDWGGKDTGILKAIRQPQPYSSWGHAALLEMQKSMGDAWGAELQKVVNDPKADSLDRVRALLLLERLGPRPNAALLEPLSKDADARVRAAAFLVVGCHSSDNAKRIAASGVKDADAFVRRRALEAIVRIGLSPSQPSWVPVADLRALLNDSDRFVRFAARIALERTPRSEWKDTVLAETNPLGAMEGFVALTRTAAAKADLEPVLAKQLEWLARTDLSTDDTLRLLRALQLTVIEAGEAAPRNLGAQVTDLIAARFPASDERLSREYARVLAWGGQPSSIQKILDAMPEGAENQPLQIHYAYCLRAMDQGWTAAQNQKMIDWFEKAQFWRGGASFQGFINFMFDSTLAHFSEAEKKMAYERIPDFAPLDPASAMANASRGGYQRAGVIGKRRGVESLSEQEIFEYMMYDPMTLRADAKRGIEVYKKAKCADCHRFGSMGQDYGPDLTTIASRFKRKDLLEAVLWPSKTISDLYAAEEVITKTGDVYIGKMVAEEEKAIHFQVIPNPRPLLIQKADIVKRGPSSRSPMNEGLLDGLSLGEIADLFAFLQAGTDRRASD